MAQTRFTGPVKSDNGFIFGTGSEHGTLLPGELAWSAFDGTVDIGLYNGVTMQVGQEVYARVENMTGSLIPNGSVVGFAGVGVNNTLLVAPYIADGSSPTLYILGVMTHDLANSGQLGYCTVWGHVRDLDTSAFSAGDILYASPTNAGGFTNVKPTSPSNVVPVAAVLKVGVTDGEIFVRPTVEQQKYYGVFSDTTTQSPSSIYTPKAVTFNTTDIANGVSRGSPTSRIVVSESGLYKFDFSMQVESGSASTKTLWIWPRVNGVDVPNSAGQLTISGAQTTLVPSWSWTMSMAASQYFEIMFASDVVEISIITKAAQSGLSGTSSFTRPAAPGVILEVTQVQQ